MERHEIMTRYERLINQLALGGFWTFGYLRTGWYIPFSKRWRDAASSRNLYIQFQRKNNFRSVSIGSTNRFAFPCLPSILSSYPSGIACQPSSACPGDGVRDGVRNAPAGLSNLSPLSKPSAFAPSASTPSTIRYAISVSSLTIPPPRACSINSSLAFV